MAEITFQFSDEPKDCAGFDPVIRRWVEQLCPDELYTRRADRGRRQATKKFLATLDDAQRGKVVFDFKDEAQRKRWSNLPTAIFKRQGLRMGDLTKPQREAVLAVLAAALSPQGYEKILQIVEADEVVEAIERPDDVRAMNIISLGQPSTTEPWMIQFGGHHLGLNITLAGEQRTLASSHTGAQPAIYELEGKTVRPSVARSTRRLPCLVR